MKTKATYQRLGIARSVCGSSHRRLGRGCDDASLLLEIGKGLVAVVCDGAGSAPLSHEGAFTAAKTVMTWFHRNSLSLADTNWQRQLKRCLGEVVKKVGLRAMEIDAKPEELATTVLVVAAWPWGLVAAQIGDGALIVEHEGKLTTLLKASHQIAANVTEFVTDSHALSAARFAKWPSKLDAFMAMTDGLENLAIDREEKPFAPFVEPLLKCVRRCGSKDTVRREIGSFLSSPTLQQRTDDDVTLAIGLFEELNNVR
jgi:serine/threonine protein phosphatase PrpC